MLDPLSISNPHITLDEVAAVIMKAKKSSACGTDIQVNLIIMISFGSIEADRVISETVQTYSKIHNLGAMTWPSYIENPIIVKSVIMRLKCILLRCDKISPCYNCYS